MATKDANAVMNDRDLFTSNLKGTEHERLREQRNWRLYTAIDYGQWPEKILRELIADGRAPCSYNFVRPAIDIIAGSLIVDPYEVRYEQEYGDENNQAPEALQELYIEDRESGNYMAEWLEVIRAGFIHRGWGEFYKDYERDDRGRVGFRYRSSDGIITDKNWRTSKVDDNRQLCVWSRMDIDQIQDTYEVSKDDIAAALAIQKANPSGSIQDGGTMNKLFETDPQFYDDKNGLYLVMDKLWLKKTKKIKLFDADEVKFLPDIEHPGDLQEFLVASKLLGRKIETVTCSETICMIRTTCPGLALDLVLQEGRHPVQVGGYPFICFSSDSINGQAITPADQLYDVQVTFNKRESIFTHALQVNANQELLIESDATEQPDDVHKIGKNRRPGGYHIVEPGSNMSQKVKPLITGGTGNMDYAAASRSSLDLSTRLTPAVPALSATDDNGKQSGIAFQSKVAQAQVGMQISNRFLRAAWQRFGDMYFKAAKQVYTYPMELTAVGGDKSFMLNTEGGVFLRDLPRMKVTVTQAPVSETMRRVIQQNFLSMAEFMDPVTKQAMARIVLKHLPNVAKSELDELVNTATLSEQIGIREAQLKLAQLDKSLADFQAQSLAAQAPVPGAPAAPPAMQQRGPVPRPAIPPRSPIPSATHPELAPA